MIGNISSRQLSAAPIATASSVTVAPNRGHFKATPRPDREVTIDAIRRKSAGVRGRDGAPASPNRCATMKNPQKPRIAPLRRRAVQRTITADVDTEFVGKFGTGSPL